MTTNEVQQSIETLIHSKRIILFMKGNRMFPSCGFSAAVVDILKKHKATFEAVNVLSDPTLREGIKQYSNWPTIPQLYIDGEFVGGCDIIKELDTNGELAKKLADDGQST